MLRRKTLDENLLADDQAEILQLLAHYLETQNHEVVATRNGAEAVAAFRTAHPDMVIMDVMMPVMDGYEATCRIRSINPAHWVPIIFLSADTDDDARAKALEAGGDDYLVKPINFTKLSHKIRALRRIAEMQSQVSHYARELQKSIAQHDEEQEFARHLIEHFVRKQKSEQDRVDTWVAPAEHLSGDVAISARTPTNQFNILLADATGHGLAAAISVLPVIETFYSMTDKGYTIPSIVREINRKVKHMLPSDRFIAAILMTIDYSNRTVKVWNGGAPEAVFVNDVGNLLRAWISTHPALGVLSDAELDSTPQVYRWDEPGEIMLCSDGLSEAEDLNGTPFSMTYFLSLLCRPYAAGRFQLVIDQVQAHINGARQRDDISLLAVRCASEANETPQTNAMVAPAPPTTGQSHWRFTLCLSAEEIRQLDILPLLMHWLDQLHIKTAHRSHAFMILGELFNNALDHGLLRLDSSLKQEAGGFEHYMNLRDLRLTQLADASIEIELARFF